MSIVPIIGYQNLLRDTGATVTSSGDAAGFPYQYLYDWNACTFWQPSASGAQFVQVQLLTAKQANYFAFYNQSLYLYGGSIKLQWSTNGSSWNDAFTAVVPTTNAPGYVRFSTITAQFWRVVVTSTTPAFLAVASFGMELVAERGCFVGFNPPTLARATEMVNNTTQTGAFVGRSVIRKLIKGAINLDMLSQNWVRFYWLPFILHAERLPFFLLWNENRGNEVAFVYSSGVIAPCSNTSAGAGFMSAAITYQGNVE